MRRVQRACQFDRIAVAQHMHVHGEGAVAEQMVVHRRHLQAAGEHLGHGRVHLVFSQYQVAHDHAVAAHLFKGVPTAKGEPRPEFDAVKGRLDVGARQGDAIDAAARTTRRAEDLCNLLLLILLRLRWRGGAPEPQGEHGGKRRCGKDLLQGTSFLCEGHACAGTVRQRSRVSFAIAAGASSGIAKQELTLSSHKT
jgi:hypothetical protein